MYNIIIKGTGHHRQWHWMAGLALGALVSGAALAQDPELQEPSETRIAPPSNVPEQTPGQHPNTQAEGSADQTFEQAFPEMVSNPIVQGEYQPDMAPPPAWPLDAVAGLIGYIEQVDAEGLDPSDYALEQLQALANAGPSDELDELATKSFTWLVEDIRDGRTPMDAREQWFVIDPDRLLFRTPTLLAQAVKTRNVAEILDRLHPTHADYKSLRDALALTPEQDAAKRKLIRANMDRWRWLGRDLGKLHLITNVPEFQLRLRAGAKTFHYKTIVGKPGRTATPQLAEKVSGVVFNPTWTVPQSIVKGEGLGERVLGDAAYAKKHGYKATRGSDGWITVVQQPGKTNSLGVMKLEMPNPHAIFFHDTPTRWMFERDMRALSHGCIRTENALQLAMLVAMLGKGATREEVVEISSSGEYTKVMLQPDRTIPAYITYFTMGTNIAGELVTFEDIYDRDGPVLASFDQPRQENRSSVNREEVIVIENNPLAGEV